MTTQKCNFSMLALLAALALAWAQDKPDAPKDEAILVKSLKESDVVFTARIGKVEPLGQTNSIPASIFGKVTFKDLKALQGALPRAATFSYSYREGMMQHMDLMADGQVLVAIKKDGVSAVVRATDANLALAKKVLGAKEK